MALSVGVLAAAAFWAYRLRETPPQPGELRVLNHSAIIATLIARGVPPADAVDPFEAGGAIKALAKELPAKELAAKDPAAIVAAGVKRLVPLLAPLTLDLTAQGREPIRSAEELATALAQKDPELKSVTSYEATVLLVALLRERGVAALLAEVFALEAPTTSADVSGSLGRYVVAVYPSEALRNAAVLGKKELLRVDPTRAARLPSWHGGSDPTMRSLAKALSPLDDASAAARIYALRAQREVQLDPSAPQRAYELVGLALSASAKSPTLHSARAMVLAQAGGSAAIGDALDEARKAHQLRSDGPRRNLLAQLLIAQGRQQDAMRELEAVIKAEPRFWPAHQTLGALKLLAGDREGARAHLDQALKLAPNQPSVLTMRATQLLADGATDQAIKLLRQAVKAQPHSEQVLLQLYMALLKGAEDKEARTVRRQLLAVARDPKRVRALLKQIDEAAGVSSDEGGAASRPSQPPATGGSATSAPTPSAATGDAIAPPTPLPSPGRFKLPDVKLTPPSGLGKPFQLPDVKLIP